MLQAAGDHTPYFPLQRPDIKLLPRKYIAVTTNDPAQQEPSLIWEQLGKYRCTSKPRRVGRMATLLLDNFDAEEVQTIHGMSGMKGLRDLFGKV
jgi:hypothetical protein